ncbi:MAG: sugar phosphate nucleotidyltransferase [Gemmataceae bacterium]
MLPVRGVILAGGKGTRLGELTRVTNKHLLPVGPFPMVYHPLKKLVGAGIKDIVLVTGTEHMGEFVRLLGSGRELGVSLTYRVQDEAGGIAQALGLAHGFCAGARTLVILGDNIFFDSLGTFLDQANANPEHAWLALKRVPDPQRFGVAQLRDDCLVHIEEKPARPRSDLAVAGIYLYPPDVFDIIKTLRPSARGELEITDVNRHYLQAGQLGFTILDGYWSDAGTFDSLEKTNRLVRRQPPQFDIDSRPRSPSAATRRKPSGLRFQGAAAASSR